MSELERQDPDTTADVALVGAGMAGLTLAMALASAGLEVTVIDRGPHRKNRIIDLSRAAASKLGFVNQGIKRICIERLQ